jgi:hypothetical protein
VNAPQDFSSTSTLEFGAYRGYRWWHVIAGGLLQSPWYGSTVWHPERNEAACIGIAPEGWFARVVLRGAPPRTPHPKGAPERACRCGFYGLHRVPLTDSETTATLPWAVSPERSGRGPTVFGITEAWGRIFVGEHGFRAQFARPLALFLAPGTEGADRAQVAARYPSLAIFPSLESMVAEFSPEV